MTFDPLSAGLTLLGILAWYLLGDRVFMGLGGESDADERSDDVRKFRHRVRQTAIPLPPIRERVHGTDA